MRSKVETSVENKEDVHAASTERPEGDESYWLLRHIAPSCKEPGMGFSSHPAFLQWVNHYGYPVQYNERPDAIQSQHMSSEVLM